MANWSVAVMVVVAMMAVMGGQAQEGNSCISTNGQPGTCTSIQRCELLQRLLQAVRARTVGPSGIRILRNSVCGVQDDGRLLVCCPQTTSTSQPPEERAGRTGRDLLPTSCGAVGLSDHIIDGEDAPLLAWPWMALLRGKAGGQPSVWFCGGVLISDRYVLTASHCFNIHELEFVRLGEHTLSENPDCQGVCAPTPQDIPVEQIIIHPQYKSPCKECNDIALLRLSRPAQLNPLHVVPICVPVDPLQDMGFPEEEFQGKVAWAAGWGSTSRNPHTPRIPDKLQQVLLPIREDTICPLLKRGYPEPRMVLCAGGDGKDTCKGDSGGPLQLSNKAETRRFVVGITSQGPEVCGRQDTQALYTNVHYYVPWILQNLRP